MKTWIPVIRLTAGFLLAWFCGWLFIELGELTFGWILDLIDGVINDFVQADRSVIGTAFMTFLSWMGSVIAYLIIGVPLIIVLIKKKKANMAVMFLVMVGGGSVLTVLLKAAYGRIRPEMGLQEIGKSFPSGHALVAISFYGFIVLMTSHMLKWYWRPVVWVAYISIVLGISVSRIYLGVHWTTDVIAGLLAGTAWMIACTSVFSIVEHIQQRRRSDA
ncbi:MAG: phosphatase PAP2 family protein [Armatimonadota bacterium]